MNVNNYFESLAHIPEKDKEMRIHKNKEKRGETSKEIFSSD
jgi:translation initiation factor IF-1